MGKRLVVALVALACAACTTVDSVSPVTGEVVSLPDINLLNPLANNWTIAETPIGKDSYRLLLRARYFRLGGDGEAIQFIRRRALQLQQERGASGYQLLDYVEGIESSTPFNYRVSAGTVRLVGLP